MSQVQAKGKSIGRLGDQSIVMYVEYLESSSFIMYD